MNANDVRRFHGQSVLLKSRNDQRNPPIAVRGTLEVHDDPSALAKPVVRVVLDFPEMYNEPAHQKTLVLSDAELANLTAGERGGFELVTDQALA